MQAVLIPGTGMVSHSATVGFFMGSPMMADMRHDSRIPVPVRASQAFGSCSFCASRTLAPTTHCAFAFSSWTNSQLEGSAFSLARQMRTSSSQAYLSPWLEIAEHPFSAASSMGLSSALTVTPPELSGMTMAFHE